MLLNQTYRPAGKFGTGKKERTHGIGHSDKAAPAWPERARVLPCESTIASGKSLNTATKPNIKRRAQPFYYHPRPKFFAMEI